MEWSTYLGGNGADSGVSIAVDSAGYVLVSGTTQSSGWISGGFDTNHNGGLDAFVAKLSPTGDHLWSTYLGGSDFDRGGHIAVDTMGNVLVTGYTWSSNWVSGGFDTSLNGAPDGFVAKLSPTGDHLWSTYLGGSKYDSGFGIAVDSAGNVLVTGATDSSNWASGGFDTSFNGGRDVFVVKLSSTGDHLWSTYLGGSAEEYGYSIAVDSAGDVLVTGYTESSGWVSGGFDTSFSVGPDAFVAKLSATGAHLWSTYLGGSGNDFGNDIAVDTMGNVLVAGYTRSSGWVSGGFDTSFNGELDAFVVKLSPSGAHLWSTYVGGDRDDYGNGIAVDSAGNLLLTGLTDSWGWVSGGFDNTFNGGLWDGFVTKLESSGAHLWSTYFGGGGRDSGGGIVVDTAGNVLVTGETSSSGWVSGGFNTTLSVAPDAFVLKIHDGYGFPRIVGVQVLTNGNVRLTVEVTGAAATNLVVESTGTLASPISWEEETTAVITTDAAGVFKAEVPAQGNTRFYRIRLR